MLAVATANKIIVMANRQIKSIRGFHKESIVIASTKRAIDEFKILVFVFHLRLEYVFFPNTKYCQTMLP